MSAYNYRKQVSLLLKVLAQVAEEPVFALHGGTGINLFARNMPRLSIDIDLTYIPIQERSLSFLHITKSLKNIKSVLEKKYPEIKVVLKEKNLKLQVNESGVQIKVEVSQINRGLLYQAISMELCQKAQKEFNTNCSIKVVSLGQLYGGKIVAALERQHPRDLFDIKYLLENEGITEEIKNGFLLALLSSNQLVHKILHPTLIDQRKTLVNKFKDMSAISFTYEDFKKARKNLIRTIPKHITDDDKEFILNFTKGEPNWMLYDFERFPSIQWKLKNINILKYRNPKKHELIIDQLQKTLYYSSNY